MSRRKLLLAAALVALAGCLALAAAPPKKLSATGFVGRTGEITVIADTDLASHAGEAPYLPLIVWVGHQESRPIKAVRDSFVLVDPNGQKHQLAGLSEVRKAYGSNLLSADRSRLRAQAEHYQYAEMEFDYARPIPRVTFFPDLASSEVMYDEVELPRDTYFRTLLYFSNPGGRPTGLFTLVFTDSLSGQTVEVPLTFTWSKR